MALVVEPVPATFAAFLTEALEATIGERPMTMILAHAPRSTASVPN